ncbi:CxxH/CxxC protein [Neobacillus sp. KR4-4]|uniref:CxxH/CxxC protein n=2 Tax=Bacillales TaxID=1385 RepID=UPI000AEB82B6
MKMIYSCEEHVDIALDDIVDEFETFPVLSKIDGDNLSTHCEYCQNQATYVVANK